MNHSSVRENKWFSELITPGSIWPLKSRVLSITSPHIQLFTLLSFPSSVWSRLWICIRMRTCCLTDRTMAFSHFTFSSPFSWRLRSTLFTGRPRFSWQMGKCHGMLMGLWRDSPRQSSQNIGWFQLCQSGPGKRGMITWLPRCWQLISGEALIYQRASCVCLPGKIMNDFDKATLIYFLRTVPNNQCQHVIKAFFIKGCVYADFID